MNRRLRSNSVALTLTVIAASALTGCSTSDGSAICVDPVTEERVDDGSCDDVDEDYDGTGGGFYWFYIPSGTSAPAVGSKYNPSSGYYKAPSGKSYSKGGVSSKGGTISKGGFGSGFGKSSS